MRGTALLVRVGIALGCAGLASLARPASAQDISDVPITVGPRLEPGGLLRDEQPYWSAGRPRWFAAATFDAGAIFFRPELDLGWGKPHHAWGGLVLGQTLSLSGGSTALGAKLMVPGLMIRGGGRYHAWGARHLLERRSFYTREQLGLDAGPPAAYFTIDGELNFDVPLPLGHFITLGSLHYVGGVPDEYDVFEQSLRIVVEPPLVWRSRSAWLFGVGPHGGAYVGPLFEMVGVPARDEVMLRAGPVLTVALTHHLQAVFAAAFAIESKDALGLEGADFGQISLSYRWATGDKWPEFP